jgi:hypothetical protein
LRRSHADRFVDEIDAGDLVSAGRQKERVLARAAAGIENRAGDPMDRFSDGPLRLAEGKAPWDKGFRKCRDSGSWLLAGWSGPFSKGRSFEQLSGWWQAIRRSKLKIDKRIGASGAE